MTAQPAIGRERHSIRENAKVDQRWILAVESVGSAPNGAVLYMMIIRPVAVTELDRAYAVLAELRPNLAEPEFRARLREASERDDYRLIGAFDGSECVAILGVRVLVDMLHGHHYYVDDLVVTEHQRGRGIGAKLLETVEADARSRGFAGVRLSTGIDHAEGRRFYEREGWTARAVVYKKGFG